MESDGDSPTSRQGGYHSIVICKNTTRNESTILNHYMHA